MNPPWVIDLLIAIVVTAVALIIVLFVWRKRTRKMGGKKDQPANVAFEVTKVEIADNAVKFSVAKGHRKKRWVIVKEIPVYEITHIENFGNKLSVTRKDVTDTFFTKEKTDLFSGLVGQVNTILEDDQRKTAEKEEKDALRRNELLGVTNASVGIIDLSFDVLIGLQEKRIKWQRLEGYSNSLGENISFTAQTMPPMNLDLSKIAPAVKSQLPKETSNEAFRILAAVYGYFDGLNPNEDQKENHPNFQDAKTLISAYFMLNDVFLGKVVGDKENSEEVSQLEGTLQNLAAETNFKVNVEELKGNIDRMALDSDKSKAIERNRKIFKEQLKQLLKPNNEALTSTNLPPKNEASTEPTATPANVAQPAPEAATSPTQTTPETSTPPTQPEPEASTPPTQTTPETPTSPTQPEPEASTPPTQPAPETVTSPTQTTPETPTSPDSIPEGQA